MKALNKDGQSFRYLLKTFPRLGEAKLKKGLFVGPQIRNLTKGEHFDTILEGAETEAWGLVTECRKTSLKIKAPNANKSVEGVSTNGI